VSTIVVIDDDEVIRDLLETVLMDQGHVPVVVSALDEVASETHPDLVITDLVTVKGYDRESAARWVGELRDRFAGVPLIVVTAHRQPLADGDDLGADAVMAKPFDVEALLARIDQLVG
jgi:DNA-binding response OmpR family regulator